MPLSNGYDSNLILHTIRSFINRRIHAFTIGGKKGRNEIPFVSNNLRSYNNIVHHTGIVDECIFEYFPDIVWRLDGTLYEGGVFLQYALSKLAREKGAYCMICG